MDEREQEIRESFEWLERYGRQIRNHHLVEVARDGYESLSLLDRERERFTEAYRLLEDGVEEVNRFEQEKAELLEALRLADDLLGDYYQYGEIKDKLLRTWREVARNVIAKHKEQA